MTDREFKRLRKAELIEIIYELERRQKKLEEENEKLREQIQKREMDVQSAGNLAMACAQISNLFQAAQDTADEYLEQIRLKEQKAQALLQQAQEKAEHNASALD